MPYEIRQWNHKDFSLEFRLQDKPALVKVEVLDPRKMHVECHTDGYHWLHFWMAQEPCALNILELPAEEEEARVRQSLYAHGFGYEIVDKEVAILTTEEDIKRETIDRLARYLEPRFALRKIFFPAD